MLFENFIRLKIAYKTTLWFLDAPKGSPKKEKKKYELIIIYYINMLESKPEGTVK